MNDIDWENIHCFCGEKRKVGSKNNKIWFNPKLSDKKKGKMVFHCTNHDPWVHLIYDVYKVKNQVVTVRAIVIRDKYPTK